MSLTHARQSQKLSQISLLEVFVSSKLLTLGLLALSVSITVKSPSVIKVAFSQQQKSESTLAHLLLVDTDHLNFSVCLQYQICPSMKPLYPRLSLPLHALEVVLLDYKRSNWFGICLTHLLNIINSSEFSTITRLAQTM